MGIITTLDNYRLIAMNKTQQVFAVTAICLSIILAGAIIAYKPGMVDSNGVLNNPGLRYPTGVGPSLGVGAYTYQGDEPQSKTISISGAGTSSAKANIAKVNLGVQTKDPSASEAIEDNAAIMTEVIEALKDLGFTDEDIKTVGFSVNPDYNWEIREVTGYTVSNMVEVTIENLEIVGPVIDAAGAAGANQVQGISFELKDSTREELKMQAYIAALEDAEEKSKVIADTLGLTITGVQSVTESSYSPARTYKGIPEADFASSSGTPIIEGSLTVTVNVHIVYLIE